MGRCSCRRSLSRALILVLAGCVPSIAIAATPDPLLRMGFIHPLLSRTTAAPMPIDLGADGRTDLLVMGAGVLNGASILPGYDQPTLNVLVQGEDGAFRLAQSIFTGPMNLGERTGDLNGDGLEDAVLIGEHTLAPLLQRSSGILERGLATNRESGYWAQAILSPEGGRVLVIDNRGDDPLGIEIFELSEQETFLRTYAVVESLPYSEYWVASAGRRFLLGRRTSIDGKPMYVGRVLGDGLEMPEQPIADAGGGSQGCLVQGTDAGHRRVDLWTWGNTIPFTVQEIGITAAGAIRVARMETSWVPPYWELPDTYATRSIPSAGGRCLYLAGDTSALLMEQAGGETTVLSQWRPDNACAGIILRGPEDPRILVEDRGCYRITDPERAPAAAPPPDELRGQVLTAGDWNGDGLPDLVQNAWSSESGIWLAEGTLSYPFFKRTAALTSDYSSYEWVGTGDLDGDADADLVFYRSLYDQAGPVPFFWDGWRFRSSPGGRAELTVFSDPACADMDGDGRVECVGDRSDSLRIVGWTSDRRAEDVVQIDIGNLQLGWGNVQVLPDVDGDGKAEVLVAHGNTRNTYSLYQVQDGVPPRLRQVHFWSQLYGIGRAYGVDLDADGDQEMLYTGGRTVGACEFDPGMHEIFRIEAPNPGRLLRAADIDLDGRTDLAFSDGSLLTVLYDPLGRADLRTYIFPIADSYEIRPPGFLDLEGDGDQDILLAVGSWILPVLNETLSPSRNRAGWQTPTLRIISPQPVRGILQCAVTPGATGPMRISLLDATGRRIFDETCEATTLNPVSVAIDPAAHGRRLASGVYFLRARGSRGSATARVVWLP